MSKEFKIKMSDSDVAMGCSVITDQTNLHLLMSLIKRLKHPLKPLKKQWVAAAATSKHRHQDNQSGRQPTRKPARLSIQRHAPV